MVNAKRLIMVALLSIALVAIAGTASAAVTVTVDKVLVNGNYIGVPTLLSGDVPRVGYTYTFKPDGMYTVSGTIANSGSAPIDVWVGGGTKGYCEIADTFTVPAAGTKGFSFKFWAASHDDVTVGWDMPGVSLTFVPMNNVDFVDGEDLTTHTVDEGPMSDATAIFLNGKITYNGSPVYTVS